MSAKKSKYALIFSVEKMIKGLMDRGSKYKGTFWTFTFKKAKNAQEASAAWAKLLRKLKKEVPNFGGVRVYEMHPGGHGVHIHVVIPSYVNVGLVRKYAEPFGFGRVHVAALNGNPEQVARYLAKYLAKGKRSGEFFRKRVWACVGAYEGVRCKDIEVRTGFTRWFSHLRAAKAISENDCFYEMLKFMRFRNRQKVFRSEELNERAKMERDHALRPYLNWRTIFNSHYKFMTTAKRIWDLYQPVEIELNTSDYKLQTAMEF